MPLVGFFSWKGGGLGRLVVVVMLHGGSPAGTECFPETGTLWEPACSGVTLAQTLAVCHLFRDVSGRFSVCEVKSDELIFKCSHTARCRIQAASSGPGGPLKGFRPQMRFFFFFDGITKRDAETFIRCFF